MIVIIYLVMCLFPVAVLRLIAHGPPKLGNVADRLRAARRSRDLESERDRYSKDLRRLGANHDKLMRCARPARANQMRAIERAYDETLLLACLALEIDAPNSDLDDAARVQLEADLLVHGLTW